MFNWFKILTQGWSDFLLLTRKRTAEKEIDIFSKKLSKSIGKADGLGAQITGGVLYEGENGRRQTAFSNIKGVNITCRW